MSTINLPKVRACSDITFRVSLKDNDVAIDWTSLSDVKALIYHDAQKAVAGRCVVAVDEEDSTVLVCTYAATKPQYLGINSIVIRCKYMGREKTYDKPAVDIVARTAEATGQTQISDPEVDVDIDVEEVSTSLLDNAIAAAFDAAADAEEAANLVPLQVLQDCVTATGQAQEATTAANNAADAANAAGITQVEASVDANVGTPSVDVDLTNKKLTLGFHNMKGIQGETGEAAGFGTVSAALQEDGGEPSVAVAASGTDTSKNFAFTFKNLKGDKGDKGDQGNTGSSVEYPYELVNNLTTNDATKGLAASQGVALASEVSQLEAKVDGHSANYTANKKLNASNQLLDAEGFAVSDYVPYTTGQDVLWRFDSKNRAYYILFYDSNKDFINWSDWTADYNATNQGRLITSSSINSYARGAAYLRATFTISYADAQVQVGSEVRWTPQAAVPSLDNRLDEVEDIAEYSVRSDNQDLTPSQQDNARKNIALSDRLLGATQNYLSNVRITQGALWDETGMCVTDFIPIKNGDTIIWNFGCDGDSNYTLSLYDENKGYSNYYSSGGYIITRTLTISSDTHKFLRATFKKTKLDGSQNYNPIIVNDVAYPYKDSVPSYFDYVKGNIDDARRWKPLVIGGLLNSDTNSGGQLTHSEYYDPLRVTTKSVVAVPFPGAKIRYRFFKDVPYTLSCYFFVGNSSSSMSSSWQGAKNIYNGTTVTLPQTARSIRPVFRASDSATGYTVAISASTIQGWIDDGSLALEYYDESKDGVLERNNATNINIAALRRNLNWSAMADNGMDSIPVFAHITDLHGDATRFENFLSYCDGVGVDFAVDSGDATMCYAANKAKYIYDISDKHDTIVIETIGNHEAYPTGVTTLFSDNISELATKFEYLASSGTTTTECYYYKDFESKKIRVIVLNQYEDGVYALRLGQTQISWFVNTLASTPSGYGVVVVFHAPEDRVNAESPYDVFMQPEPRSSSSVNGYYVDKRAISLIVDAFIEKGTASFTYQDHSSTYNGDSDTTTETVSVSADFSEVDESTEFICFVCGHKHEDRIGHYANSANKQLCLGITTGNALYGDSSNPAWSNQSDLPRGGVGVSQDAFCIYAIDRLNGNVKVIRVGATVTQMMVKREMMVIPYK